jgi:hypothetical protein
LLLLAAAQAAALPASYLSCSLSCLRAYQHYWFFVNLQQALDRSLIGLALAAARPATEAGPQPASVSVRVKAFPWPATLEDLGAASAAAFFNLLLVYAFLAPTRWGPAAAPDGSCCRRCL